MERKKTPTELATEQAKKLTMLHQQYVDSELKFGSTQQSKEAKALDDHCIFLCRLQPIPLNNILQFADNDANRYFRDNEKTFRAEVQKRDRSKQVRKAHGISDISDIKAEVASVKKGSIDSHIKDNGLKTKYIDAVKGENLIKKDFMENYDFKTCPSLEKFVNDRVSALKTTGIDYTKYKNDLIHIDVGFGGFRKSKMRQLVDLIEPGWATSIQPKSQPEAVSKQKKEGDDSQARAVGFGKGLTGKR